MHPMTTLIALWHLSRPRLLPYVLCLVIVGMAWGHWDRALTLRGMEGLGWVLLAWWALHAGTLWLNAALDQDEGEVLYGRAVRPPKHVALVGYAALLLTVGLAVAAGSVAGGCALGCALLSVLYSHPKTQWKGHPIGGPLVNGLGYGLLSPMAGWSLVGVSATPRTVAAWGLGLAGVLSCYFMAQAFQEAEDAERGYRTLVVTHGPDGALFAARLCLAVAFAGGMLLAAVGWFPRICLLGAPLWWWVDRWLLHWHQEGGGERRARVFAGRILLSLLVMLALVFSDYAWESYAGQPVAGLGTAAGHPPDRPLLPPRQMRLWEYQNGHEFLTDD